MVQKTPPILLAKKCVLAICGFTSRYARTGFINDKRNVYKTSPPKKANIRLLEGYFSLYNPHPCNSKRVKTFENRSSFSAIGFRKIFPSFFIVSHIFPDCPEPKTARSFYILIKSFREEGWKSRIQIEGTNIPDEWLPLIKWGNVTGLKNSQLRDRWRKRCAGNSIRKSEKFFRPFFPSFIRQKSWQRLFYSQ